jgi:hypothetical protein
MIKVPSLYYSKKTLSYWKVCDSDGFEAEIINMVEGAQYVKRKISDIEKAVEAGVWELDERQSGVLQLYQNKFHLEAKREREAAMKAKEAKFKPSKKLDKPNNSINNPPNLF